MKIISHKEKSKINVGNETTEKEARQYSYIQKPHSCYFRGTKQLPVYFSMTQVQRLANVVVFDVEKLKL